jgi:signal transduction histidine kinase
VKFTAPGGSICCTARRAGGETVISVADTGIGIAPADHARIFEPFIQIGDTLTGKPAGTGLGLSICKQIVEQHGGRIWVESEVAKGSTFSIALPVDRPNPPGSTPR